MKVTAAKGFAYRTLEFNQLAHRDSLSMLGACVGWAGVPVEAAVEEGVVPGLEVEALAAGGEAALEAEVLPPSAALRGIIHSP